MTDRDTSAFGESEFLPGPFRQPCLIWANQRAGNVIERGDDGPLTARDNNARVCRKALSATDMTVFVHEDMGFVWRLDAESTSPELITVNHGSLGRQRDVTALICLNVVQAFVKLAISFLFRPRLLNHMRAPVRMHQTQL